MLAKQAGPRPLGKGPCAHPEASPVLDAKAYGAGAYKLNQTSGRARKVVETLTQPDRTAIRLEQYACGDRVGTIYVGVPPTCTDVVKCATDRLKQLKFNHTGFFLHFDRMKELISAALLQKKNKGLAKPGGVAVCLARRKPGDQRTDCVTDVRLQATKTSLSLNYIDRS